MSDILKIYKVAVVCENCLNGDLIDIPFKTLALDYIINKECKNCGNKRVLRQVMPQHEQK